MVRLAGIRILCKVIKTEEPFPKEVIHAVSKVAVKCLIMDVDQKLKVPWKAAGSNFMAFAKNSLLERILPVP